MTDPRLEEMLRHCRAYKKQLDRKRRLIRTVMLCPPVLVAFERIITFILTEALEPFDPETGTRNAVDMLSFLAALAISIFAGGETVLEGKRWIELSMPFYGIASAVGFVLLTFFPVDRVPWTVLAGYCLIAVPLNILFKRLYEENQMLKRKKGYPHFDPRFISEEELREEKPADPKQPDGLTPDERLMRERGYE